jgi:hypothetical protein
MQREPTVRQMGIGVGVVIQYIGVAGLASAGVGVGEEVARVFGFLNRSKDERGDRVAHKVEEARRKAERQFERKLARMEEQNAALQKRLAAVEAGTQLPGIDPRNVMWVFGSGRTGSSWLTFMMGALHDHTRWNEPHVGYLFGHTYYERSEARQDRKHFVLSDGFEDLWMGCARHLVLGGGAARFPERTEGGYLVIKEPHGSMGAPLLMRALPESRMIFLVRDPRDVISSALAVTFVPKGGRDRSGRVEKAEQRPEEFVFDRARRYLRDITRSREAYEAHAGLKSFVRYEDLRVNTLQEMKRIYADIQVPVDAEELARVVERRAFENVPEEKKGTGTIRRKAKPGGWREDLTPEQIGIVEEIWAPLLKEYYPS